MKKADVEETINVLDNIKKCTATMDFKTSSYINQQVVKVLPLLEDELTRLETAKVKVNCPKLFVMGVEDLDDGQTLVDALNIEMSELVENGYKIIDFGLYGSTNNVHNNVHAYIKYTD